MEKIFKFWLITAFLPPIAILVLILFGREKK